MWPLYVYKTIFNQTNSINQLYSQPISDFFIAEKPPSLALTTTFCLPFIIIARCVLGVLPLDISATFDTVNHDRFLFILYPGFLVCGTAIDRFRSNRTQFTLIAGKKNYNLASSNVTCLKALSSEHHWLTFCVMITCNFMSSLIIHNYTSTFYETFSLELAITIAKIQDCSSDLNK